MIKKDFNQKVSEMCAYVKTHECEDIREQLKPFANKFGLNAVFAYAHWCERNFEANLREDYKRKTTYTSDFSIAEWCVPVEGMSAIASTLRNALTNWRDDIKFFGSITYQIENEDVNMEAASYLFTCVEMLYQDKTGDVDGFWGSIDI